MDSKVSLLSLVSIVVVSVLCSGISLVLVIVHLFNRKSSSVSDNSEYGGSLRSDVEIFRTSPGARGHLQVNSRRQPFLISPGALNKPVIYNYNGNVAQNTDASNGLRRDTPNCSNNSSEVVNHRALTRLNLPRPMLKVRAVEDTDSTAYESIIGVG